MIPANLEQTNSSIISPTPVKKIIKDTQQPKVKVFCRLKPSDEEQKNMGMQISKTKTQLTFDQPKMNSQKIYTFNHIFTDQNQQEFVKYIGEPILQNIQEKKKGALVFSYGVTNSGKTYSILGSLKQPGILPYLIKELKGKTYITAIQLYNDQFFSLINKEKIVLKQLNGLYNLNKCGIQQQINEQNMEQKFKKYVQNRSQSSTKFNNKSSRSHAIFRIDNNGVIIGVVDLAGSQRINKVGSNHDQTSNINKSLLSLGKCIKALNNPYGGVSQLPYRQSKLTRVLMEYFITRTKIIMIANIHPLQKFYHENLKVLDYASLAKQIKHNNYFNQISKSLVKNYIQNSKKIKYSKEKTLPLKSMKKQNQDFLKALKIKQLQACIKRFQGSQETFDFFLDQGIEQQRSTDEYLLKRMRLDVYKSPLPQRQEVAVGISNQQDEKRNIQYMRQEMMKQLKQRLQEQRKQKLIDQETYMSPSFGKKQQLCTPQKSPNFTSKLLNSIKSGYSSAKKIFTYSKIKKQQKIKKIHNFQIMNYNKLYENIFNSEIVECQQKSQQQQQSMYFGQNKENQNKKDFSVQTYLFDNQQNFRIRKSFQINLKEKKVAFIQTQNTDINSYSNQDESDSESQKQKKNYREDKAQKNKRSKKMKNKVALAREEAAKICRNKSRTPIKCRLRSKKRL